MSSARALPAALAAALIASVPAAASADGPAARPSPGSARSIAELLARADGYRLAAEAMEVATRVEVWKAGALDKERTYQVYVRPGRRSLVLSRSPAERGQKVLMTGDDFWIVLPSSQRPIRITPAQKLLGDASTGDVATLTWAEDYTGTLAGEEEVGGVPCARLELQAARRGVTYARITLFLARADDHPVAADLYVASERLAKRASFEMGELEGRRSVVAMVLHDEIQTGRETRIRYLSRRPRALDDAYFNPMYLTHHEPE